MSVSRHPIALRLERLVGGSATLLATVMALPLVDGIFPALVLAGALDSPVGVLEVGLLVFGGSATLAVVLAEMDAPPRQAARAVLLVGAVLVVGAGVEAALAPTIASVVDLVTFERFAALVIAAIAAKTASARVGEYLPRPAVIVGLGLVASVDPSGATFEVTTDPTLVVHAVAAALVGTLFALGAALFAPRLRRNVDVDRFRFGSAVALGLLSISVLGFSFQGAPLAVVAVTGLLAFNPEGSQNPPSDDDDDRDETPVVDELAAATESDADAVARDLLDQSERERAAPRYTADADGTPSATASEGDTDRDPDRDRNDGSETANAPAGPSARPDAGDAP
jgi:hypothetical protein